MVKGCVLLYDSSTQTYEVADYIGKQSEVVIPSEYSGKKVTGIQNSAFVGCDSIVSITIPDSVTYIGNSAFYNCDNLASITIPDGVTSIGSYAFSNCDSMLSVTIPDSVTSIEYSAFSNCDSLTSISIPDSVTSIGGAAFWGCDGLTDITIPDSVTSIGESAFRYCNTLTSITLPFIGAEKNGTVNNHFGYIFGASNSSDVKDYLPKNLKTVKVTSAPKIGSSAFEGCSSIASISITDSVTSIGESAFA